MCFLLTVGCHRDTTPPAATQPADTVAVAIGPPMATPVMEMPAAELTSARWEPHHAATPAPATAPAAADGDSAVRVVPIAAAPNVPGTLYLAGTLQFLTEPDAKPVAETFAAVALRDRQGDLSDPMRPIMGVMDLNHLVAGGAANRWLHEAARELQPDAKTKAGDTATPWRVTLPVGRKPQGDTLWLTLGFLEVTAARFDRALFDLPAIGETVAVSPRLTLVRLGDEMRPGSLDLVFEVQHEPAMLDGDTVRVAAEPIRVRILADEPTPRAPREVSRLGGWRCEDQRSTCVALGIAPGTDLAGTKLEVTWAEDLSIRVRQLSERRVVLDQLVVPMEMP